MPTVIKRDVGIVCEEGLLRARRQNESDSGQRDEKESSAWQRASPWRFALSAELRLKRAGEKSLTRKFVSEEGAEPKGWIHYLKVRLFRALGLGQSTGDGKVKYEPENILETYTRHTSGAGFMWLRARSTSSILATTATAARCSWDHLGRM